MKLRLSKSFIDGMFAGSIKAISLRFPWIVELCGSLEEMEITSVSRYA